MGTLVSPILFSKQFKIPAKELDKRDLLDPVLNSDTKVFIDPLLLRSSNNKVIATNGLKLFRDKFHDVLRLVGAYNEIGDVAWKAAFKNLGLDERKETCLGFGGSSVSGSSRPADLKQRILITARQILDLGIKDPEIISLMGFLEEGVGPDTISDMATNAIVPALVTITQEVCDTFKIPKRSFWINRTEFLLPSNPFAKRPHGILLVPRDILRDLPIAVDMSDVSRVAFENQIIRERVNALIVDFAKVTLKEKKKILKEAALQSAKDFLDLFESLLNINRAYDPNADPDGIYSFRHALEEVATQFPRVIAPLGAKTEVELARVVREIIDQFRDLIENKNISALLWNGSVPRKEKAAQLVFYAIAEAYCRSNNIEIAPETHSGGGPVDFRFSKGFNARYVVELKLSTGSVEHGYETQLETYRAAADNCPGALLVIKVGSQKQLDKKLKAIETIRQSRIDKGEYASEIYVVDATLKPSASRR